MMNKSPDTLTSTSTIHPKQILPAYLDSGEQYLLNHALIHKGKEEKKTDKEVLN